MHRLDQAETLDFGSDREKKKAHEKLDFDRMKDAISAVKKLSKKLDPSSCFSHNDLLSGNILVPVHHVGTRSIYSEQKLTIPETSAAIFSKNLSITCNECFKKPWKVPLIVLNLLKPCTHHIS